MKKINKASKSTKIAFFLAMSLMSSLWNTFGGVAELDKILPDNLEALKNVEIDISHLKKRKPHLGFAKHYLKEIKKVKNSDLDKAGKELRIEVARANHERESQNQYNVYYNLTFFNSKRYSLYTHYDYKGERNDIKIEQYVEHGNYSIEKMLGKHSHPIIKILPPKNLYINDIAIFPNVYFKKLCNVLFKDYFVNKVEKNGLIYVYVTTNAIENIKNISEIELLKNNKKTLCAIKKNNRITNIKYYLRTNLNTDRVYSEYVSDYDIAKKVSFVAYANDKEYYSEELEVTEVRREKTNVNFKNISYPINERTNIDILFGKDTLKISEYIKPYSYYLNLSELSNKEK